MLDGVATTRDGTLKIPRGHSEDPLRTQRRDGDEEVEILDWILAPW